MLILYVLIILIMVYVLNATLYRPINRILEARERRTKGRLSEAQEILSNVSNKLSEYERKLRQARAEAYAFMEAERGVAMQERQKKLNEMRQRLSESAAQALIDALILNNLDDFSFRGRVNTVVGLSGF